MTPASRFLYTKGMNEYERILWRTVLRIKFRNLRYEQLSLVYTQEELIMLELDYVDGELERIQREYYG